jgi:dihydropteroate synthase
MIGKIIPSETDERLPGTIALHTAAILKGADVIRVHDVKEAVQAARVTDRLRGL